MAQIQSLVHTLKKQLKAHGKTYVDVANALELSEASVKRLFSEHNFTLQRLESISQLIGLQISDLIQLMLQEQPQLLQLTTAQEEEIVSDPLLLMVTVNVINGLSYQDLVEKYSIESNECIQRLTQLDGLNIIELLPKNRIKLLVSPNFTWLPNGPIQQFYQQQLEHEFFQCKFDKETEKLIVLNGILSTTSNRTIQKKMQQLAHQFNELIKEDMPLGFDEKYGTTAVFALRQWQCSLFDNYVKK